MSRRFRLIFWRVHWPIVQSFLLLSPYLFPIDGPLTISHKSNRYCFNDGYHTSHHLHPRRHWRDHPLAFTRAKPQYRQGRALVFQNIDYIMMTVTLLRKDYLHLASCLVPMGDQIGMSQIEIADMLRTKTKKFSEGDILRKYGKLS